MRCQLLQFVVFSMLVLLVVTAPPNADKWNELQKAKALTKFVDRSKRSPQCGCQKETEGETYRKEPTEADVDDLYLAYENAKNDPRQQRAIKKRSTSCNCSSDRKPLTHDELRIVNERLKRSEENQWETSEEENDIKLSTSEEQGSLELAQFEIDEIVKRDERKKRHAETVRVSTSEEDDSAEIDAKQRNKNAENARKRRHARTVKLSTSEEEDSAEVDAKHRNRNAENAERKKREVQAVKVSTSEEKDSAESASSNSSEETTSTSTSTTSTTTPKTLRKRRDVESLIVVPLEQTKLENNIDNETAAKVAIPTDDIKTNISREKDFYAANDFQVEQIDTKENESIDRFLEDYAQGCEVMESNSEEANETTYAEEEQKNVANNEDAKKAKENAKIVEIFLNNENEKEFKIFDNSASKESAEKHAPVDDDKKQLIAEIDI